MLQQYKKKINLGIGIGLILSLGGKVISSNPNETIALLGSILGLMGIPIFIYGLSMYAKAKGRSWVWGILGFLNLIGLIILYFLKDLEKDKE